MRTLPTALVLGFFLVATGCLRHGTCAEEPDNRFCLDAGRTDAGPRRDAGQDAGIVDADANMDANVDGGPDASRCGVCSGGAFCVERDGGVRCDECRTEADCAAPRPVCEPSRGDCVECVEVDDCASSSVGPICTDNACVECGGDDDCPGVCIDNACVECRDTADCAVSPRGQVCNVDTNTCGCAENEDCVEGECRADGVCGSTRTCGMCTDDTDCLPDRDCVEMFYGEDMTLRADRYCMKRLSTTCDNPFTGSLMRTPTAGGDPVAYCAIAETITTCEAVNAMLDDRGDMLDCPTNDCPGLGEGAACRTVGGAENRCTSRCNDESNCLGGAEGAYGQACTDGFCD
ncbi:MAG: hypothetical protein AB8I08_03495 [Sandaracinaceae bacterium]